MTLTFIHISEDEFETLFSFLAGYKQMGSLEEPDKALANKLFDQLIPVARSVYGFEFDKIMNKLKELKEVVAGMNIVVEKKYPTNHGEN